MISSLAISGTIFDVVKFLYDTNTFIGTLHTSCNFLVTSATVLAYLQSHSYLWPGYLLLAMTLCYGLLVGRSQRTIASIVGLLDRAWLLPLYIP
jgi:thiosulfate reductase cytochrome b subunit